MDYVRTAENRRLLRFLAVLAGSLGVACATAGGALASVYVFPVPGAHYASPQTQITFRGIAPSRLGTVTVTGSRSGRHSGRMLTDSDGDGGSFVPSSAFTPGERVTVTTGVALEGGKSDSYQFIVAVPARSLGIATGNYTGRAKGDVMSFQSRRDLQPPAIRVLKQDSDLSAGDILTGNQAGPLQNGPMVLDPAGNLVWFKPLARNTYAADVRVQTLNGAPVITWWQGGTTGGIGDGVDVIDDTSYRQRYVVRAGNGLHTDLHEFLLTPQGTAWVTADYPVYANLSSVHGPSNAPVLDGVVQEIDVKTGLVLFQWDTLDHVPVTDSYSSYSSKDPFPFDYFHINSVQPSPDGNVLISGRNTWAGYDVNPNTGAVNWNLGGRHSTFTFGSGASFAWQHDVRMLSPTQVTLFDDGAGDYAVHHQSRALSLTLDLTHRIATQGFEFEHLPSLLAYYEGNSQLLPDGNYMVGWGGQPYFTEFSPTGSVLFDARFVDGNTTYRVYRMPWTGIPNTRPAVAANRGRGIIAVYASWDGDTQVTGWRILGGTSASKLATVATVAKNGFETRTVLRTEAYVAVQALNSAGRVLSQSVTVAPR